MKGVFSKSPFGPFDSRTARRPTGTARLLSATQAVLRVAPANTADSANGGHALVEGGETAIPTAAASTAVMGAPRKVPGIGMRVDPHDAGEKCGHQEESLHYATPLGCFA